jgi:hypothetical protein
MEKRVQQQIDEIKTEVLRFEKSDKYIDGDERSNSSVLYWTILYQLHYTCWFYVSASLFNVF